MMTIYDDGYDDDDDGGDDDDDDVDDDVVDDDDDDDDDDDEDDDDAAGACEMTLKGLSCFFTNTIVVSKTVRYYMYIAQSTHVYSCSCSELCMHTWMSTHLRVWL